MTLFNLIVLGFVITALDLDNALYMTSMLEYVAPNSRRRVIVFGLLIEFFGRILLILIFSTIFSGQQVLFEVFGFPVTAESLALIGAGIFLIIRSTRELLGIFKRRGAEQVAAWAPMDMSFPRLMLEMGIVATALSVDTVIAITGSTQNWALILYLLTFSAVIRFFFVDQIGVFINKFPSVNVVVLIFLILIGLGLILQGFGSDFPENIFNTILALSIIGVIIYERQHHKKTNGLQV